MLSGVRHVRYSCRLEISGELRSAMEGDAMLDSIVELFVSAAKTN